MVGSATSVIFIRNKKLPASRSFRDWVGIGSAIISAFKPNLTMKIKTILMMGFLTLLCSCKTYTIPVDSFREQMTKSGNGKMQDVAINNPISYSNIKYKANNVKSIVVVDKNGNNVEIGNSPKLEIRITGKNGKKYILPFDTVIVENDTLKGARSRMLHNLRREIPLDDIEKIEIQDSGKAYKYQ